LQLDRVMWISRCVRRELVGLLAAIPVLGSVTVGDAGADPAADALARLNKLSRQAEQTTEAIHQMLALPAFHCFHGIFQSPRPSVPGSVEPTVLITSTMSPRLELS
jgi:hypothetical protein